MFTLRSTLLLLAVLAFAAPALCKDPPPPTLRAQTTTGQISTQAPTGLLAKLPFTMRIDPGRQMALISFTYLFQTIQVAWNGQYATLSIGGDCDTDYFGDFPFSADIFAESTYSGSTTLTTPYYSNLTANHFSGDLDIDYYYYYYYYYYDSLDSLFYDDEKRDVESAEEVEEVQAADEADEADEAEAEQKANGIAPGTAHYDLYTMFTNPDFILRWVLYVMPGVPGTVIDYQTYDYAYIPDAAFQPTCFTRRDVPEEGAKEAPQDGDALSALIARVMDTLEVVRQEAAEDVQDGEQQTLAAVLAALEADEQ